MRALLVVGALCLVTVTASAVEPRVDVSSRARGAEAVVVATVVDVQSTFDVNDYGDQLIVSHALLRVDESLKGATPGSVTITVEGGTVGDLTLSVSDMPTMRRGERAVVFMSRNRRGGNVPHGRGLGVLKLDDDDHVGGTDVTLDDIREAVRNAQANR